MTGRSYGPKEGGNYETRARMRWGDDCPDWVLVLARTADSVASQTELGKKLNVSPASISAVIGKTYPGKLDAIEAKVKGALMSATVTCPVMGEIGRDVCAENQCMPFTAANPTRAQIWRACRAGCPNAIAANLTKGATRPASNPKGGSR
jgi:hypothetical protein